MVSWAKNWCINWACWHVVVVVVFVIIIMGREFQGKTSKIVCAQIIIMVVLVSFHLIYDLIWFNPSPFEVCLLCLVYSLVSVSLSAITARKFYPHSNFESNWSHFSLLHLISTCCLLSAKSAHVSSKTFSCARNKTTQSAGRATPTKHDPKGTDEPLAQKQPPNWVMFELKLS